MKVLSSGQSNALGRGTGGPPDSLLSTRVVVWDNRYSNLAPGSTFKKPEFGSPPFAEGKAANNLAAWFCHHAALALEDHVNLVLVAFTGRRIANWIPDRGAPDDCYTAIVQTYRDSDLAPADVFLWHQGESDGTRTKSVRKKEFRRCVKEIKRIARGRAQLRPKRIIALVFYLIFRVPVAHSATTKESYKSKFRLLVRRLREDGILDPDAPVIVGGLRKPEASHIDSALRELADSEDLIHYATAHDLKTVDRSHLDGPSLAELGRRYWIEYQRTLGN